MNTNRNRINSRKSLQGHIQPEEDLHKLSSRYDAILAAIPDIIMEVDTNKVYTWANQAGFDFFGPDVLGKEVSYFFIGEQDTLDRVKLLFDGDESVFYVESWQRRKDGEKRLLAWWCQVLKDASGTVTGAISSAHDITDRKQIEEHIRLQNQLFERTIESLSHPFYVIDANDYKIKIANTATSFFSDNFENITCHALTHDLKQPCRGKRHSCPLEEVKRTKKPVTLEHVHYNQDGEARYVEIHGFPIFDDEGNVSQMIEYSLDITERKQLEEKLLESEERWRSIAEYSPDHIIILNKNLNIEYVNFASPGLTADELIGTPLYTYVAEERQSEIREILDTVLKTGELARYETKYNTSDGSIIYYESSVVPRVLHDKVVGITVHSRDITERKKAEEELSESESKWRSITENSPDYIMLLDRNVNVIFINHTIPGLTREEVVGTSFFDYVLPEYKKVTTDCFNRVLKTAEQGKFESTYQHEDGTLQYLESYVGPVMNSGKIVGLIVSSRDITDRKQAEINLRKTLEFSRQREAEVSALLEGSRAVLHHHNFEDAAKSIFYSCKELIGATAGYVALINEERTNNELLFLDSGGMDCTVDPSLLMPIRGLREQAFLTGKAVYENDFQNSQWADLLPTGHAQIYNVLFAPLKLDGNVIGLLGIANKPGGFTADDVRIASAFGELASIALMNSRNLESLEASEQRFRSTAQSAGDAIISIDSLGKIVFWNKAAEKIFGYTVDEIISKSITLIMPERFCVAHQTGMNRVILTGKSNLLGKTYEMVGLRKNGREFPVELSISSWKAKDQLFFTGVVRDITERKILEEELQRSHNELESRVIERTKELIKANDALRNEIAEHKRTEKKMLDYQQKLRSLASDLTLTEERERRRIATDLHDSIGQALALSKMKLSEIRNSNPNTELCRDLEEIHGLLEQTIQDTRSLTFKISLPILYELGLESALEWLTEKFQVEHGIQANFNDDGKLKPLDNDIRSVLFRSVQELLFNVAKHAKATNVAVSTRHEGESIRIYISDDGIGFDVSVKKRHKAKKKSFGLFSVKERLDFLGGKLEIKSEPGQGTRVTLEAPLNVI